MLVLVVFFFSFFRAIILRLQQCPQLSSRFKRVTHIGRKRLMYVCVGPSPFQTSGINCSHTSRNTTLELNKNIRRGNNNDSFACYSGITHPELNIPHLNPVSPRSSFVRKHIKKNMMFGIWEYSHRAVIESESSVEGSRSRSVLRREFSKN